MTPWTRRTRFTVCRRDLGRDAPRIISTGCTRVALRAGKKAATAQQRMAIAAGGKIMHRRIVDLERRRRSGQHVEDGDLRPAVAQQISENPSKQDPDGSHHHRLQ